MIEVVSAVVSCSQICIWKAGTPPDYTPGWAQQGQREPTRTPPQGPFFYPEAHAVERRGPVWPSEGQEGLNKSSSPLLRKAPRGLQEEMLP